jgi:hypothetical protein
MRCMSHCSCGVRIGSCQADLERAIGLVFGISLGSCEGLVGVLVHHHFDRTDRRWPDVLTPRVTDCVKPWPLRCREETRDPAGI